VTGTPAERHLSRRRIRATLFAGAAVSLAAMILYAARPHRGFVGEYHAHPDLGDPIYRRVDRAIHFDWRKDGPARLRRRWFGVRWTGTLEVPAEEPYTFHLQGDGEIRLVIDDRVVIATPSTGPFQEQATVRLGAGSHALRVEYANRMGLGAVALDWASPSFPRRPVDRRDVK
jgi:hypothetical protein